MPEPKLTLYNCEHLSFFSVCEELIVDQERRRPLERICSLMRKGGALWMLLHSDVSGEKYFNSKYPAIVEECEQIVKLDPAAKPRVFQLTFFGSDIRWPPRSGRDGHTYRARKNKPTRHQNQILGTCVVIKPSGEKLKALDYVFEAVIAIPTINHDGKRVPVLNNYIHVASETEIIVAGYLFKIDASYYCQQNSFSGVCAHSCLKMTLWHLQSVVYQPSTNKINRIAKRMQETTKGREIRKSKAVVTSAFDPGRGFTEKQIIEVCKSFKGAVFNFDCEKHSEISPYEMAYLLVESGIPTIIIFQANADHKGIHHMVPVIGHTMNTDEWFPFAIRHYTKIPLSPLHTREHDYLSSAEWAPHLIMHDDLLGPYFCIGPNALTRKANQGDDYCGRASRILGIFPARLGSQLSPIVAQEAGRVYFWNLWTLMTGGLSENWSRRLNERWTSAATKHRDVVLRTQIVTRNNYVGHLQQIEDHDGHKVELKRNVIKAIRRHYPKEFWLVEFSLPELFCANRTKLGEIAIPLSVSTQPDLWEATKPGDLIKYPLSFRMGGHLQCYAVQNGRYDLGIESHTKLYVRRPHDVEY